MENDKVITEILEFKETDEAQSVTVITKDGNTKTFQVEHELLELFGTDIVTLLTKKLDYTLELTKETK